LTQRIGLFLATCGYVGLVPVAPGTAGSAVGLVLFYATRRLGPWAEIGAILAVFSLGVWAADVAERAYRRTDPGPVVIDEVLGVLITLCWLPVTGVGALVGFLVFRVLDVVKPWPAARLESLHGGLGVMADDAMAGVYSQLVMRALIAVGPEGWLV
jgi:phosphatidylglycerophosphatase A